MTPHIYDSLHDWRDGRDEGDIHSSIHLGHTGSAHPDPVTNHNLQIPATPQHGNCPTHLADFTPRRQTTVHEEPSSVESSAEALPRTPHTHASRTRTSAHAHTHTHTRARAHTHTQGQTQTQTQPHNTYMMMAVGWVDAAAVAAGSWRISSSDLDTHLLVRISTPSRT